jgi:hypothetical protein
MRSKTKLYRASVLTPDATGMKPETFHRPFAFSISEYEIDAFLPSGSKQRLANAVSVTLAVLFS